MNKNKINIIDVIGSILGIVVIGILGSGALFILSIAMMCGGLSGSSSSDSMLPVFLTGAPFVMMMIYLVYRVYKAFNNVGTKDSSSSIGLYIINSRKEGRLDIEIEEALIKEGGWQKKDVREAFRDLK